MKNKLLVPETKREKQIYEWALGFGEEKAKAERENIKNEINRRYLAKINPMCAVLFYELVKWLEREE